MKVIFEMENLMASAPSRLVAKRSVALGKMDVCRVRGKAQSASPYQLVGDRNCDMASRAADDFPEGENHEADSAF